MRRFIAFSVVVLLAACIAGCDSPTDFAVSIDAPLNVKLGEEFTAAMTVQNLAAVPQLLVDLDIGGDYLQGIAVLRTEPDHAEVFKVPLMNMTSYSFNQAILPGGQLKILFYFKAIKKGDYSSDVDFVVNNDFNFLTKTIRTIVE